MAVHKHGGHHRQRQHLQHRYQRQLLRTGGSQVAFIKDNGSISQSVYFTAGAYNISFLASQRLGQTQDQQIEVLVDTQVVGVITPTLSHTPGSTSSDMVYVYTPYQTTNFTVGTGMHTITFQGMIPASGNSTALIDSVTLSAGCNVIDGSFEDPVLAPRTSQAAPAGTAWQFAGSAGVTVDAYYDKSSLTTNNPKTSSGYQTAFITNTGSISQSVYLDGSTYHVSFLAAQAYGQKISDQSIEIEVDGTPEGVVTPDAPSSDDGYFAAGAAFGLYSSSSFTLPAGTHVITFVGVATSGNNTALIDNVQLNA